MRRIDEEFTKRPFYGVPRMTARLRALGHGVNSLDLTGRLEEAGIKVSLDGRGRVYDNIFVERLWRSVKYEEVYLHDHLTVLEARRGLSDYFVFYNEERPNMDRVEIVDCRANGEAVFSGNRRKMAIRHRNG